MPPTYSPWLNAFERLARFGLARRGPTPPPGATGQHGSSDCAGGEDWRALASGEALWSAWGPPQASLWSAFHRPTLFAALDGAPEKDRWPAPPVGLAVAEAPRAVPDWADARTGILLDLPGTASVAYGGILALRAGHEPVATFNNWPHARGVVDGWPILGALLYYAPWVVEARERRRVGSYRFEAEAPAVFLLDANRLGRDPRPGDFDNRYFLLDSDLPTEAQWRRTGVERVVYVRPASQLHESDDLNRYLHDLGKRLPVLRADARHDQWELHEPRPFRPEIRTTPFNTTRDPVFHGFRRSAAGGFGKLVPEPSQGGGGFG